MSIKLSHLVWTKQVSGATQTILLVLADFANDEGVCWPSQALVAWKAGCTDRTVRNVITDLKERGVITEIESGQGRGKSSILQIHLKKLPNKPEMVSSIQSVKPEIDDIKPEIDDIKPETAISYDPLEPSKNHQDIVHPRFETWYLMFPRKQKRADAEKAWNQIKTDEERQAAIDALPKFLPYYESLIAYRSVKWVPLPATWLRAQQWLDETIPEPETEMGRGKSNGHALPAGTPGWYWEGEIAYDLSLPQNAKYIALALAEVQND